MAEEKVSITTKLHSKTEQYNNKHTEKMRNITTITQYILDVILINFLRIKLWLIK